MFTSPVFIAALLNAMSSVSTTVPATEGRTCVARVFSAPKAKNVALILEVRGTGEYTMAGGPDDDPEVASLISSGKAAWVVFDKPGVRADSGAKRGFVIDDKTFNNYTMADLESCARGALVWASGLPQVGKRSAIVLYGHSEGAIVVTRALLASLRARDALAPRVTAMLLSGTPGGSMIDVLNAQETTAAGRTRRDAALDAGDDAFFRSQAGAGAGTLRALIQLPSLATTFRELAELRPNVRIALFHGRDDASVPVSMVEALERENRKWRSESQPALDLSLRTYAAGHGLNAAAGHDLALWFADAIRPDGYLAHAERPAPPRPTIVLADALMNEIVGRYRLSDTQLLEIVREGSKMFSRVEGQPTVRLFAQSPELLFIVERPIDVRIERQDGGIAAVTLIQDGETRCPRISGQ